MGNFKIKEIYRTPKSIGHFFGYFDKPQLATDQSKLLVHRIKVWDKYPNRKEEFEVGYFNINDKDKKFYQIGKTNCINFQMGSNLQWLNNKCKKVLFNKRLNNKYVSIIKSLKGDNEKVISPAVYCIDRFGYYGLAINFNRHDVVRPGYSYRHETKLSKHIPLDKKDWIKLVDLRSGVSKTIIELETLLKINPLSSMNGAFHYIEHLTFSPNGRNIVFFHRWKSNDKQIYTRVLRLNLKSKNLDCILDSGRGSHYCWLSDDDILIYGGENNFLNKARSKKNIAKFFFKPVLPIYRFFIKDNSMLSKNLTGDAYWKLNIHNGRKKKVLNSLVLEDGHPTVNENFIVTDTYSAKKNNHNASLYLVNGDLDKDQVLDTLIIQGDIELDESPFRCDLHPRFSYDTNYFSIDAFENGNRISIVYKILKT